MSLPSSSQPVRRVTQKDIAKQLGISQATVSMAFANSPRLTRHTRERINKAAADLGYAPDPMLRSLATYRSKLRPSGFRGVLGWLTPYQIESDKPGSFMHDALQGATDKARELGYRVDALWIKAHGMTQKRLDSILRSRGIQGILLPPRDQTATHTNLNWKAYAAIAVGDYTNARPALDMVVADHFRSMEIALRQIKRNGFKRIGYINDDMLDRRLSRSYSAAFLTAKTFARDLLEREMCSINFVARKVVAATDAERLREWAKRFQPDVLIYTDVFKRDAVLKACPPLQHGGFGEVLLCLPALQGEVPQFAGIDEGWPALGARAIEVLVARLHHGIYGLPSNPQRVLVEGVWKNGVLLKDQQHRPAKGILRPCPV